MGTGFDAVEEKLLEMSQVAANYSDYRPAKKEELPFRAPSTEAEKKACTKEKAGNMLLLGGGSAVMAALTVLCFVQHQGVVIMTLLFLVFFAFFCKSLFTKTTVMDATVIYKTWEHQSGKSGNAKHYFVTAVVEEPEKMMCSRVRISQKDYESVQENSKVLIVCLGSNLKACAK